MSRRPPRNFDTLLPTNRINLSTSTSASSSSLLSTVRAERAARDQRRKEEHAALQLQRVWRGRKAAGEARRAVLQELEAGLYDGPSTGRKKTAAVWFVLRARRLEEPQKLLSIVDSWLSAATTPDDCGGLPLAEPLSRDEDYVYILGAVLVRALNLTIFAPASLRAANIWAALEKAVVPAVFDGTPDPEETKRRLALLLESGQWVETLVTILETLVALSLPKKKHPHLLPVVRLMTAPLALTDPTKLPAMLAAMITRLLTIPSLPSVLPIPALTHLSQNLPIFTVLLPAAADDPAILSSDRLADELAKTYFLANLATFGITGSMLSRQGLDAVFAWMKTLGVVLSQVEEGWGRWTEGQAPEEDDILPVIVDDDDDEPMPLASALMVPPTSVKRKTRPPLPPNIGSKLLLLATTAHLTTLSSLLLAPSSRAPPEALADFAIFVSGVLTAFRGTNKWEVTLDSLLAGDKGRALVKRIWREGVRGKWADSAEQSCWDHFDKHDGSASLVLLSHLYTHYLLFTPDDEFFSSANLLTTDEVLDLSAIWRNLAFWGYMSGVANENTSRTGKGREDFRSLFTRGVTRVSERNARRRFAAEDFWVMPGQEDLRGFVAAAVFEDAQLDQVDSQEDRSGNVSIVLGRRRQRFSKRQMAYISPRLGLLNNLPMAVPFLTRLEAFRQFINSDRDRLGLWGHRRDATARIRRPHLAEDGFDQLNDLGPAMKGTIYIKFYDQFGHKEQGVDGGGLFKEFLTNLSKEIFNTDRGLWLATDQNALYPNPHAYAKEPHQLNWFSFIGRVLGKAIYEGILVDVSFAGFFLAKWLGRQTSLDDLSSLDHELYKGLTILKNYPQPEDLALNFTITQQDLGVTETIDLVPGGADIPVTAENRHEYIALVCKYKLDTQISEQSKAFFNGLADIIDQKWIRMFDQQELQQLLGGEETPIDVNDWRENCNAAGFGNDRTMQLFWKVVGAFSEEEKRSLLKFVTSCERPPLLGFAYLSPKMGIRSSGTDVTRLPSASSCFNLLKMPEYADESSLRTKLLQAINSGAGFDFS